jgi:hypothetical protein
MPQRKKAWLKVVGLTLLPIASIFPVVAAARFGPKGPSSVWPILFFVPVAMWMQTRALSLLLKLYRHRRDPGLLAILPLGVVSVFTYTLSGTIFILSLPSIISRLI